MTVMARHNTPAYRAAQRPRPVPTYTQEQLRVRRRSGLPPLDHGHTARTGCRQDGGDKVVSLTRYP